ncbi:MAG: phosphate acyltransferase PlsX [Parvibaculales bacterium]
MVKHVTIAIDGMGGDKGPETVIEGVEIALSHRPDASFIIFGDEDVLTPIVAGQPQLSLVSEIRHTDVSIPMDAKPSQALRQGRKTSSMWLAIDAVKNGEADAVVSAGNTGALMAMSKVILKTLPGIERPAIAALWPTLRGEAVVLDVGATVAGDAQQYLQFAVMGDAYARIIFGLENPRISLLNIGEEDVKGTDEVKLASELLSRSPLNFKGFIEGSGIGQGEADVVVTDGFTGNVALKTAEGTAHQISTYLKLAMASSLWTKIGFIFAQSAFRALKKRMDPNNMNGGMFLGLNGVVVKSHGGADDIGYASAVELAMEVAGAKMSDRIAEELAYFDNTEIENKKTKEEA